MIVNTTTNRQKPPEMRGSKAREQRASSGPQLLGANGTSLWHDKSTKMRKAKRTSEGRSAVHGSDVIDQSLGARGLCSSSRECVLRCAAKKKTSRTTRNCRGVSANTHAARLIPPPLPPSCAGANTVRSAIPHNSAGGRDCATAPIRAIM